MQKSKLVQVLSALNKREKQQFRRFVKSPYFNTRTESLKLLDYLLKKEQEATDLDRQQAFKAIWGRKEWDDSQMRLEISYLYKLLKRYLAQLNFEADEEAFSLRLLRQLRERQLERVFTIEQKRLERHLEAQPYRDANFHEVQFNKESEANGMYGQQYLRLPNPHLQAKIDHLDQFYLMIKLKEACEMRNRERILGIPYQQHLIPEIRQFLAKHPDWLQESPSLQIYLSILTLQDHESNPNVEQMEHLRSLLQINYPSLNPEEARGMFKHAVNYCIRQVNRSQAGFKNILFHLYEQGLQNQLLSSSGQITPSDFINISLIALQLGKEDWASDFIEQYQHSLPEQGRENAYYLTLAHLYRYQGHLSKAIQLLQEVQFSDISYQLNARMLLLFLFYDQQEWESALYHIEAFQIFVRRQKQLFRDRKKAYINQLTLSRKLILIAERGKKWGGEESHKDIESLHRQLQHTSQLVNRDWLVGKLSEIRLKEN